MTSTSAPIKRAARGQPASLTVVLLSVVIALALALRIAGARGDLWLDEIWSLLLVADLSHPLEVFWRISHDNNHFLNSLWLAIVGPEAPAWLDRLPSALLGTATVLAAARLGWRRGQVAGVLTAFAFAVCYPMVHYGSEARGYAGLILCTVVAIDALERALDGDRRAPWILGIAIGAGALFHLTMVVPAAILGVVAALRHVRDHRGFRPAIAPTLALFRPAEILLLPAAAALAAGVFVTGGFTIGSVTPFSAIGFLDGYGGLVALTLGLPQAIPLAVALPAVLAALALLLVLDWDMGADRRILAALALLLIPAAMALARLGNTEFPRYFLFAGVVLLIVVADVASRAITRRGPSGLIAAAALAAFAAGQAGHLTAFLTGLRGDYATVVDRMGEGGPATYLDNAAFKNGTMVDHFARRAGLDLQRLPDDATCASAADWYLHGGFHLGEMPVEVELPGPGCARRFRLELRTGYAGLSGWEWALYRRDGG